MDEAGAMNLERNSHVIDGHATGFLHSVFHWIRNWNWNLPHRSTGQNPSRRKYEQHLFPLSEELESIDLELLQELKWPLELDPEPDLELELDLDLRLLTTPQKNI